MKKLVLLALLALSIAACKTTETTAAVDVNTVETAEALETEKTTEVAEPTTIDFKDKQWNLVELNGKEITQIENQMTVASFTLSSDGKINGSSGCNGFGGTYTLDGAKLTVSPLMGTMMFCEGITYEAEYLKVFSDGVEIAATETTLSLSDSTGTVVGKFDLETVE